MEVKRLQADTAHKAHRRRVLYVHQINADVTSSDTSESHGLQWRLHKMTSFKSADAIFCHNLCPEAFEVVPPCSNKGNTLIFGMCHVSCTVCDGLLNIQLAKQR